MTALAGVFALIISIISVAVPYWGYYAPAGAAYISSGFASQDNTGNFGPFQTCKNVAYYTYCGGNDIYKPTTWIVVAGISAIITVVCLGLFSLFAILHVAMQLQRKEIMVSYPRSIFLKGVTASIGVLTCLASVILGALEFTIGARNAPFNVKMGVCYYLQIVLIFVSVLLVILSYYSYKKFRKNPNLLPIVPRSSSGRHQQSGSYDAQGTNGAGVAVTQSSGSPYHGRPRMPIQQPQQQLQQPQQTPGMQIQYPNYNFSSGVTGATNQQQQFNNFQQQQQVINGGGVGGYSLQPGQGGMSTNGFTPVTLSVPMSTMPMQQLSINQQQQPLPVQSLRPIQPVQGVPQIQVTQPSPAAAMGAGTLGRGGGQGVSFAPGGRTNPGYNKISSGGKAGSMESLDSTQSLTLSTYSYGSSTSTGSGHGPLRSSLKKPKQRDIASVSSKSSSKQVRISLGAEQTTV